MTTVKFTIVGKVKGKQRPRMTRRGRVFTPQDTINYENLVKISYQNECGDTLLEGPLECWIDVYHKIPKSMSKKKRALIDEGEGYACHSPDLDNCAKSILDGLNGICYSDDRYIVKLHCTRRYSDRPRAEVTITELEELE